MVQGYSDAELRELVELLITLPKETEWLEFKENNTDPLRIGEYISSLANTAALENKACGYLVWGVADSNHDIVGTTFNPGQTRVQSQELEFWLSQKTKGEIHFSFAQTNVEGQSVVVLTVDAARNRPIEFDGKPFVRVASSNVQLKKWPDHETRLWNILRSESFETGVAYDGASDEQVIGLLDFDVFFARSGTPRPSSFDEILRIAESTRSVRRRQDGAWQITNLGALVFAKRLSDFPSVERRGLRVVEYSGKDRIEANRRQDGAKGYAVGFSGLLTWIKAILPARESYVDGQRTSNTVYSDLLLREVVANAVIHQDFLTVGSGPLIEVFSDRIEVTNPGIPLLDPDRLINHPPMARNLILGNLMRQMNLCEEAGTGWDKIAFETELAGLPSPKIELEQHATRVTIFGPRKLTAMEKPDKVRAVYFHACLRWAMRERLTNASLRARFGISANNSSQVSRLLADALEHGQIRLYDESVGNRARSYVPYWAPQN